MALHRGIDGSEPAHSEPLTPRAGIQEERRDARGERVATGTLACPRCDAPVAIAGPVRPGHRLNCPFCLHGAAARDFLSLAEPARPQRVAVRVVHRSR